MEEQLIQHLKDLVSINSVNPDLSKLGQGEKQIAEFVHNHFTKLNIESKVHIIKDDRCNTTAFLKGNNPEKILLLNGHLDTVGIEDMKDPFILKNDGDHLYGRGTYDMLAGCAIQMALATFFSKTPCPISLAFTFVADEENMSIGMEYLIENYLPTLPSKPFLGIFMEPTEEAIGISHKGYSWYELKIEGLAAHGSRPEQGINAIFPMEHALSELSKINKELLDEEPHPHLGHATLHPGMISGGTAKSVIASESNIKWERRTLPGESKQKLDDELQRVISAVLKAPGDHKVTGSQVYNRPPNEVKNHSIIETLRKVAGNKDYNGMSYWADSALATMAGIPSILFGPAGHGAHAIDEWVSKESMLNCYKTMKKFILEL